MTRVGSECIDMYMPARKQLHIMLSRELWEKLQKMAKKQRRTITAIVTGLLERAK